MASISISQKAVQEMHDQLARPNPLTAGMLNDFTVRVGQTTLDRLNEIYAEKPKTKAKPKYAPSIDDDMSDADKQKLAEKLARENMKDTDYSRRIVIAAGEQISCTQGHYVATCIRTQYAGETIRARDFGGWRGRPEPKPGTACATRCVECGAAFMSKVQHRDAFAIFVTGRGWSDRALQPRPDVKAWNGKITDVAEASSVSSALVDAMRKEEDHKRWDAVIAAARERKRANNKCLDEITRTLRREDFVQCSGNSLAAALAVPLTIEGELHDVVMPYRARG